MGLVSFVKRFLAPVVAAGAMAFASAVFSPALSAQGKASEFEDTEAKNAEAKKDYFNFDSNPESKGDTLALRFASYGRSLFGLMVVVIGLFGLASLVLATINLIQGEQGAAKRMFMWGGGLMFGLALLSVYESFLGKERFAVDAGVLSSNAAGAFMGVFLDVKAVMLAILGIVSMIMVGVVSIHIMKGERDGLQKFLNWLLVSTIGFTLLQLL